MKDETTHLKQRSFRDNRDCDKRLARRSDWEYARISRIETAGTRHEIRYCLDINSRNGSVAHTQCQLLLRSRSPVLGLG